MSILIKGVTMPKNCFDCPMAFAVDFGILCTPTHNIVDDNEISKKQDFCPLIEIPPHGDLIDRDALIKDGWLNLYKEVMRMGGYAVHELPLKNPSIPVIIPASEEGE